MPGKLRVGKEPSASSSEVSSERSKKYSIWPKWTEEELASEKWEVGSVSRAGAAEGGGRQRKGTASLATPFAGSDVKCDNILPPSLSGTDVEWVTPGLYITYPKTPVIVADPDVLEVDLVSENKHLMHSELMCSIISQLQALWHFRSSPTLAAEAGQKKEWRPWNHIYHTKEQPVPLLNPFGKYCIKIFWMGSWRKITVSDHLPLRKLPVADQGPAEGEMAGGGLPDEVEGGEASKKTRVGEGKVVLLPRTADTTELWPAIVTKAILRVAALDYKGGKEWSEYGDCNVLHMLTGWLPQSLPTRIETELLWSALYQALPLWKRPPPHGEDGTREVEGEGEREGGEMDASTATQPEGAGEDGGEAVERKSVLVMAEFTSACNGKPLTKAKEALMNASLSLLKENHLISDHFDPHRDHSCPMLITHVRDIPLEAPPKEPPPIQAPKEHAWLGYSMRRHAPWEAPPPEPPPPRWVEVIPPFPIGTNIADLSLTLNESEEDEIKEEQQSGPPGDPPSTPVPHETSGDTPCDGNGTSEEIQHKKPEVKPRTVWMTFEDFKKAFSNLEIFSSPSEFKHSRKYADLTATVENTNPVEETRTRGQSSHSPANKKSSKSSVITEADDTNILFMEEGESESGPIELHFVFMCLSNWREGSTDLKTDRKKSIGLKQRRASILANPLALSYNLRRLSLAAQTDNAFGYSDDATIPEDDEAASPMIPSPMIPQSPLGPPVVQEDEEKILPGSLIVEEFDWKSIETKVPMLRLVTTGVKGAVMKLDNSKHILKIHAKAPLGYHLSISSKSNFLLTNEDSAYTYMHKKRIAFSKMYSGPIPGLQSNSWALVFREVLLVQRSNQKLSFKLDFPVSAGHLLRVVDNDEGQEIPRVGRTTEPHLYSPNRKGYTILGEMWTHTEAVQEGNNWRLRVISSHPDLPLCEGLEEEEEEEDEEKEVERDGEGKKEKENGMVVGIAREFHHREIREYCLPDRDNIFFRYSLKVSQDCPVTLQLRTSKTDAYIQLEILDGDTVIAETRGRAYCFIPVCQLPAKPQTAETMVTQTKYVATARVIHDSWPLADTAWPYIGDIKIAEEADAAEKAALTSGGRGKKSPSTAKSSKPKKSKGGGAKDGGSGAGKETSEGAQSSTSLSNFDSNKPHWILRVPLRQSDKDYFEMCKDTEKEDELKSMQTAWETQQPGRLKKGQESRKKFLDAHALKEDYTEEPVVSRTSVGSTVELPSTSSLQPPRGPIPLQRIDLALYTKYSYDTPRVLTAEEEGKRDDERRETIRQYREWRRAVLKSRDEDRQLRNEEKLRQLEEADKQQNELEKTRKRMNRGREKIRQRCLAEEKAQREAEQAALKAAEEEAAAGGRDSKAKGKKGKKK